MGSKRDWSANVSMVYWICKAMNKPKPTYAVACKIANRFCFFELDRMYRRVKSRSRLTLVA